MIIPRDYQIDCLGTLEETRNRGADRGLGVMATGLGKTVTVALDAKRYLDDRGGRLLYLCHKTDILDQARDAFYEVMGDKRSYGFFHGTEKNFHEVDCLFSSFNTMINWLDLFDPREFSYIVVDESHHSHADTYSEVIKHFKPNFLLGLTATPDRMDQQDIRTIYGQEIFSLPLEKALAMGYLTPVEYRILTDEIQAGGLLNTPKGQFSVSHLNRTIFVPRRDEEIARILMTHTDKIENPKVIIFCSSVKHCDHLTNFIPDSLTIHSGIPDKERAVRLELFRQDMVNTVITVDCFNEGIDIPRANVIVFLRSTNSRTIFLQQLGRGLRKVEGKDKVVVLDFVANVDRIKIVQEMCQSTSVFSDQRSTNGKSMVDEDDLKAPITLDVGTVFFDEREVPITHLLERVLPKMISEVSELLNEFSSENPLPATQVLANSHRKYSWICSSCQHTWMATPRSRLDRDGITCPACSGEVVTEKNNLTITHPKLALEYSSKNELPANQVFAMSGHMFKWTCVSCVHEWNARGFKRVTADPGCPMCGYKILDPNSKTRAETLTHINILNEQLSKEEALRRTTDKTAVLINSLRSRLGGKTVTVTVKLDTKPPRMVSRGHSIFAKFPELAKEYSDKNPLPVKRASGIRSAIYTWCCSKCNTEWKTSVGDRLDHTKDCPACPVATF